MAKVDVIGTVAAGKIRRQHGGQAGQGLVVQFVPPIQQAQLAERLGLIDLGEDFRAPLHSDVPALFVSGTLDGRTPLANAEALLPGFANGTHQLVRGASHDDELWLGNPQLAERLASFLAGSPASSGVLEVAPPRFASGKLDALLLALGISWGAAWGALAVLLAAPLTLFVLWRRWRKRRRRA